MPVRARALPTAIAVPLVLMPTLTRTGPRSPIWPSAVASRIALLKETTVCTRRSFQASIYERPLTSSRQETEAPPRGPRKTRCLVCIARTVPRRTGASQGHPHQDSFQATSDQGRRQSTHVARPATRPAGVVRLLQYPGGASHVRPAMYSPAVGLPAARLLLSTNALL